MKSEKIPYPLRLEEETKKRAKKAAKDCRWSLNTWLIVAAEEKLERDQRGRAGQ